MFGKRCNRCLQYSYSSNVKGKWSCPYCAQDISYVREGNTVNKVIYISNGIVKAKKDGGSS